MTTKDFKKIIILVETKEGVAHQVLSSDENKRIMIDLLATMDNGIKLSPKINPVSVTLAK